MKIFAIFGVVLALAGTALAGTASAQTAQSRQTFDQLVKQTYNFDVSRMTPQHMAATEKSLDKFWKTVKANRGQYLPLLRAAVQNPKSNPFFRFDGVNLLVNIDPSMESKKLMAEVYTVTDLNIVGPRRWLETMTYLGKEGFDISQGAVSWLTNPDAIYRLPEHGDFKVDYFSGALFLFGSMNEDKATPLLIQIVNNPKHLRREAALSILMDQTTPDAFKTIETLDASTFSPQFQKIVKDYRAYPVRLVPREKPLTTREEFLKAFQEFVQGKSARFEALIDKVQDGERDVVAVMKPEDLPLLRRVRRTYISRANPDVIDFYDTFTDIIITLTKGRELAAAKPPST